MSDRLSRLYDPERFRADGHRLVDQLADYLKSVTARADVPVLPWHEPAAMAARWPGDFPARADGDVAAFFQRVLADSHHLHHPRYVGHQVTAPLPLAALCELAASLLNNSMAVYEMGPATTAMERAVVAWMAAQLRLGPGADGVLTSGGSLGNLTALLAMRQAKAGYDAWDEGSSAGPPLAVLASEQSHYSVARSVQIMGWGHGGVISVPVDARFRLRADALAGAVAAAEAQGRRVVGVVGSACSTAAGAFDPLEAIADFCAARGLWFHVDGAHGAAAALSPRYRPLVAGIERADSVVWDAHKMMLMPSLVTAVLFRDGARSYETFSQRASYLLEERAEQPWWDIAHRTVECTKRMMSLKVYAALSLLGTEVFADYVTQCFDLAGRFARRIVASGDFQLACEPECNIVCFRYVPAGATDLDALQARLRRRMLDDGKFYLVQTRLPTGLFLRCTLINPLTSDADLDALLESLRG